MHSSVMGYTVVVNLTTLLVEVCDLYMTILILFLKLKVFSGSQIINSYPLNRVRCYLKGLIVMIVCGNHAGLSTNEPPVVLWRAA